jgi:hypothetical protein
MPGLLGVRDPQELHQLYLLWSHRIVFWMSSTTMMYYSQSRLCWMMLSRSLSLKHNHFLQLLLWIQKW